MQATYTYDALGRRIKTDVDADGAGAGAATVTWTAYDGQNAYADFNASGTVLKRYLFALALDELLARTDANGSNADWYLTDRLGTVRDIIDATTAASEWHGGYAAFGAIITTTGTGGDRFTYTGRELMAETGDMHYRARTYTTTTGRFLQVDPIGFEAGDANLYRYVRNGPVNSCDPTGLADPVTVALLLGGGALLAGGIAGCGSTGEPPTSSPQAPVTMTGPLRSDHPQVDYPVDDWWNRNKKRFIPQFDREQDAYREYSRGCVGLCSLELALPPESWPLGGAEKRYPTKYFADPKSTEDYIKELESMRKQYILNAFGSQKPLTSSPIVGGWPGEISRPVGDFGGEYLYATWVTTGANYRWRWINHGWRSIPTLRPTARVRERGWLPTTEYPYIYYIVSETSLPHSP